ncbi:DUF5331 domain-containing protein [Limnothrix redekei]|uniref:DUF5331 domain-containing protein n=1 Tax=Limnothrix redekei LRLZ20PSL1 TaxID=3112953 RepID=A0ABW7C625_9CYAN
MNVEQLRRSIRQKWLDYYRDNRSWLARMAIWTESELGHRRPLSSFLLATATVLEPRVTELMPLLVDLSSDPDRVIEALGLDFDPDRELELAAKAAARERRNRPAILLPASDPAPIEFAQPPIEQFEETDCNGRTRDAERIPIWERSTF